MEYKVPLNVEREDKILGPLTMKGFIISMCSMFVMYISYLIFNSGVWQMVDVFILIITSAIIFLRIHDMDFISYIFALGLFYLRPQMRYWVQHAGDRSMSLTVRHDAVVTKKTEPKAKSMKDIRSVLKKIDSKKLT